MNKNIDLEKISDAVKRSFNFERSRYDHRRMCSNLRDRRIMLINLFKNKKRKGNDLIGHDTKCFFCNGGHPTKKGLFIWHLGLELSDISNFVWLCGECWDKWIRERKLKNMSRFLFPRWSKKGNLPNKNTNVGLAEQEP